MDGNGKHPAKGGNVLKTTTWGTLIALSLLVTAWGFNGLRRGNDSGPAAPQAAAKLAPPQSPASPAVKPVQEAPAPQGTAKHNTVLDFFHFERDAQTVAATPSSREVSASSSANSPSLPQANSKGQSSDGTGSGASEDSQVLMAAAKIAPDLKGIDPEAPVDVIVQYRHSPAANELMDDGAETKAEFPSLKAQLVTVKGGSIANLATHSNVAYVSPNRKLRGALDHVVTAINADVAFASGWDGSGIGVAVLDSGVSSVNDLNSDGNYQPSRIVYSQSFVAGDTSTGDPYGHGTHVSGIIAGNAYDSQYSYNYPGVYRGIAPAAKIINLRVLDGNGAGTDSSVISAIQTAINLQSTYNIRVLNLSLARGVYESYTLDPLCQAVESAWRAGIVVVVAAGNMGQYNGAGTNGYATIGAPGNDPYVITVGASNTHATGLQASQTMTSYSSKGPTAFDHIVKPDLVAPGNQVVSRKLSTGNALATLYPGLMQYPCNSSRTNCSSFYGASRYMRLSGTSMATPVVSAVAALLLEKSSSLTPDQVKARLMKTAWKGFSNYTTATDLTTGVTYSIEQDMFAVGAGSVDAAAALNGTDLAPPTVGSAK